SRAKKHESDAIVGYVVTDETHEGARCEQQTPDDHHGPLAEAGDQLAAEQRGKIHREDMTLDRPGNGLGAVVMDRMHADRCRGHDEAHRAESDGTCNDGLAQQRITNQCANGWPVARGRERLRFRRTELTMDESTERIL